MIPTFSDKGWLTRAPLLIPAVAAGCAVIAVDWMSWWAWAGIVAALALGVWSDGRRGLVLALAAACVAGGLHSSRLAGMRAGDRLLGAAGATEAEVSGTVAGRAKLFGRGWAAPVRVERLVCGGRSVPASGRVWWSGWGDAPLPGVEISASGRLRRPAPPRNPGEFDRARWLWRQGVWAEFAPDGRHGSRGNPPGWRRVVESWRSGFRKAIVLGLAPESREANVIRAMVLGERPADDDELIDAFRNSGSLHVFAVSGLHIGLAGLFFWFVLQLLRVPRRWAVPLLVAAMFGYAWLAGLRAPAVRAAWMAALVLGGFVLRRASNLLNVVAAVALGALALDGNQLFQPGFQLSYGVVVAIALFAGATTRFWTGAPVVDPFLPRSLWTWWQERFDEAQRWICGMLGVSTAAWAGSAPLVAWHFRLITPVAPFAGLVLIPMVFAVLVLAMASAALSPIIPPATVAVNRLNARVAGASVTVAEAVSRLPGSHFRIPASDAGEQLVVYDLTYGAAAVMFDPGDGRVSLFDCGDAWGFRHTVLPSLRNAGREVDSVLLSHPDSGHVGGALVLLDAAPPKRFFLPVSHARSPSFRQLIEQAPASGCAVSQMRAGETIDCGKSARWEVVRVAGPHERNAAADDRCAVVRLHWHGWKILFLSDTGFRGERRLLESGRDLAADVLVLNRHRKDPGGTVEFLEAVGAAVIVASHDDFPPEERLGPAMRKRLSSAGGGTRVLSLGDTGAVVVEASQERMALRGFANGEEVELRKQ
jgi:ComEC/Rec2-related protein